MKLFLDSNTVIDALIDRNASHDAAKLLLALGYAKEFDLWVSPSQWMDMFYILSRGGKAPYREQAASTMEELRKCLRISTLGESEIDGAMALMWADLEDAVAYMSAKTKNPMAIITRNKEDFESSVFPLFTCEEFFEWLRLEHGLDYAQVDA